MAFYRQSKRRTADFLGTLLGQPCCPALTVKIQNQVTAALRPSYEALAAELPTQEHLNIDETATKEENGKAWLWTFVARLFTVFAVRATREATALGVFLGEKFQGIVTCDRAKMYWRVKRLQWCWAHLKRDFQAMIDTGNPRSKWLGERLRRPRASCSSTGPTIARAGFRGPRWCVGWVRSAGRWSVCCCAECKATIAMCVGRVGSCTSIASGCGRFCITKGSSRQTMRASVRCVMR